MADTVDDGSSVATAPPPTDDVTQPTLAEVVEAVRTGLRPDLDNIQRQFDRRLTAVEQLRGDLQLTRAQVESLLETTLSPEEFQARMQRIQAQAEATDKDARLAQAEAALQAMSQNALSTQDQIRYEYTTFVRPVGHEYGATQGLTADEADALAPKSGKATRNDPTGWRGYMSEWVKAMNAAGDKKAKAETPPPRVPAERGAAAPPPKPTDSIGLFQRDMESKQRGTK